MRLPDHLRATLIPAAVLLLSVFPAAAQGAIGPLPSRGQVVVLRTAEVDEVTRTALARVTGELTAARFQVSVAPLDPTRDPAPQVETVAPDSRPVAAFAIARPAGVPDNTIAIWVCDRLGRRTTIQRMTMRGDISQDAEVLALEAIELIRVSVAGLWPAHARASTAPPVLSAPGARVGTELSLSVGVAMVQDGALDSSAWMGVANAMVIWPRGLAVRAQVRGLGPAISLAGDEGTATLRRAAATLAAAWVFWRAERVRSLIAFGAGVERLSAAGAAADPDRAHTFAIWSGLLTAGVGASVRLNDILSFAMEGDLILPVPATVLRVGNTTTSELSQPGLLFSALLRARF